MYMIKHYNTVCTKYTLLYIEQHLAFFRFHANLEKLCQLFDYFKWKN